MWQEPVLTGELPAGQLAEMERRSGEIEKLATERGIAINILEQKLHKMNATQMQDQQDQSKQSKVMGALELENERLALRVLTLERMGMIIGSVHHDQQAVSSPAPLNGCNGSTATTSTRIHSQVNSRDANQAATPTATTTATPSPFRAAGRERNLRYSQ